MIEEETRKLCADALAAAHELLTTRAVEHQRLAAALLEHEDLTAEEMHLVVAGKPVPPRS